MRAPPSNLAPAPGIPNTNGPSNSVQSVMPGISNHSVRFYELLDALKMEYDLSVQQSNGLHHHDTSNKMNQTDYETKGKNCLFIDSRYNFSGF